MSSSGFGQWYENQQAAESGGGGGTASASSSWLGSSATDMLPLFNTEAMPSVSFSSMKASMEAQMPKQIMGMGYQQRFKVFCGLLFLSALFFALALFVGVPTFAGTPRKFALSFTMGSLTFMASFGILKGPMEHVKSMLSADRMLFTFVYFGSMFLTLLFTFSFGGISGYLMVISASAVQLVALLWYLISFLPGGAAGLQYVFAAMAHILKPVIVVCTRAQAACLSHCLTWMANRGISSWTGASNGNGST